MKKVKTRKSPNILRGNTYYSLVKDIKILVK